MSDRARRRETLWEAVKQASRGSFARLTQLRQSRESNRQSRVSKRNMVRSERKHWAAYHKEMDREQTRRAKRHGIFPGTDPRR